MDSRSQIEIIDPTKKLTPEAERILNELMQSNSNEEFQKLFFQREKNIDREFANSHESFSTKFVLTMFYRPCKKKTNKIHFEVLSRKDPIGEGQSKVYEIAGTLKRTDSTYEFKDRTANNDDENQERVAKIIMIDGETTREKVEEEYNLTKRAVHLGVKPPAFLELSNGIHIACIVMNRLPGQDLYDILMEDLKNNTLTTDQRIDLCIAILTALETQVHNQDIVHRDIKPENIKVLINDKGIIVNIFDFGLSKSTAQDDSKDSVGSPAYVSPEMTKGMGTSILSDVHAISLVLGLIFRAGIRQEAVTQEKLLKTINNYKFPFLFNGISDLGSEHEKMIREMLFGLYEINPKERWTPKRGVEVLTKIKMARQLKREQTFAQTVSI